MMTQRKSMAGLSLVELLVALTIALVAVLAATELYLSTRQTYRVQTMQNRLSEDGRFAMSMIQRMVSQAGFRPLPAGAAVWVGPPIQAGSSQMVVRFIADKTNQINCGGAVELVDTTVTQLQIVGDTTTGRLTCAPVGTSITTACESGNLTCWIASAGAGTQLVDFQLQYGVDSGPPTLADYGCGAVLGGGLLAGDCIADDYWPSATHAAAPTATDNIVAVRACLVLRSDTTDASIAKTAAYQDCSGGDIAGSQNDHKLYRTFRTTVLLRNR